MSDVKTEHAVYKNHRITCTVIGFCFIDNDDTPYNDLEAARIAVDQLVIKERT